MLICLTFLELREPRVDRAGLGPRCKERLGLGLELAQHRTQIPSPEPRRVTLDDTYLGREGLLANPVALSPGAVNGAFAGAANPPPIA